MINVISKRLLSIIILILTVSFLVLTGCTEESKKKTLMSEEDVATLSLVTFDGKNESSWGLINLGHSFLYITNISSETITIGSGEILSGESMTIGTWSIAKHFGVWYNLESNYIKDYNKYNGRYSITKGVSADELSRISSFVNSHDYWSPINNCSWFALNLWNEVAEGDEILKTPIIYNPTHVASEIKKFENFSTNQQFVTKEKFFFHNDQNLYTMEGGNAYC